MAVNIPVNQTLSAGHMASYVGTHVTEFNTDDHGKGKGMPVAMGWQGV